MARPKKYSYENFSSELGLLCEVYKRLNPKEMIEALAARTVLIDPDCISTFVNAVFKTKMTLSKALSFAEKLESIKEIAPKKIDKCSIMVVQKKKPGRPRKYGR